MDTPYNQPIGNTMNVSKVWSPDDCPVQQCDHYKAWLAANGVKIQEKPNPVSTDNPQDAPSKVTEIICHTSHCNQKFTDVEAFTQHVTAVHVGAGRPCEYCKRKEEIDTTTIEFLTEARQAKKAKKSFIPYLQDLADQLDCDADRISLWANKTTDDGELAHPEFHGFIKSVNNLKELLLLKRTTSKFNPTGAIFQLKTKHGYIETEKQILAGDRDNPIGVDLKVDDMLTKIYGDTATESTSTP